MVAGTNAIKGAKIKWLRIHWRLSMILKANKKVYEVMFLICKSMYILEVCSIHCTLRQNADVKNISFGQNKRHKNALFFFHEFFSFSFITVFFCDSYMSWSTRFIHLTVSGIFHFQFRLVFVKVFIFVQQSAWTLWLWNVAIPFKIKLIEMPHTVPLRLLISELQQEIWKFTVICVVTKVLLTWWQMIQVLRTSVFLNSNS